MTFHRRQPLPRRRGNQWYRDRRERLTATVCGAPCTRFDEPFKGKGRDWTRAHDGYKFTACRQCWPEAEAKETAR